MARTVVRGSHDVLVASLDVFDYGATGHAVLLEEADHLGSTHRHRTEAHRGAHDFKDISGVIDLPVVIHDGAHQRFLAQPWCQGERLASRELPMTRDPPRRSRRPAEYVVQGDSGAHIDALPYPMVKRVEEGDLVDEMGGHTSQQEITLTKCLVDQDEVHHLEVTQSPVNQLARLARGPRCPVLGFDNGDREAAGSPRREPLLPRRCRPRQPARRTARTPGARCLPLAAPETVPTESWSIPIPRSRVHRETDQWLHARLGYHGVPCTAVLATRIEGMRRVSTTTPVKILPVFQKK